MVRIYRRNDLGFLNVVLGYIANQPIVNSCLNERISLTPRKAFRVRNSYTPYVNQIKIKNKSCICFTESFQKGLPLEQ